MVLKYLVALQRCPGLTSSLKCLMTKIGWHAGERCHHWLSEWKGVIRREGVYHWFHYWTIYYKEYLMAGWRCPPLSGWLKRPWWRTPMRRGQWWSKHPGCRAPMRGFLQPGTYCSGTLRFILKDQNSEKKICRNFRVKYSFFKALCEVFSLQELLAKC